MRLLLVLDVIGDYAIDPVPQVLHRRKPPTMADIVFNYCLLADKFQDVLVAFLEVTLIVGD